ncbi:zinc ribbon domain-containing protein [Secundilactobacillus folii]|uniref:Zinc-ribbon domain-containing protein n=1 Tax=Secundilactobacillus folii TaxID=2678357 RepID=A0A7X2XW27_9LACO|nr:zinc-ribbon domain-containing protein [Secundilactobacillus folii]
MKTEKGKFCTNCGALLSKDAKFCTNCGAKQPEDDVEPAKTTSA